MITKVRRAYLLRDFSPDEAKLHALIVLASYVVQIVTAIAVGYVLLDQETGSAFFGVALLVLFIGTRFRGINNIVHECSHAAFTADRHDNEVIEKRPPRRSL